MKKLLKIIRKENVIVQVARTLISQQNSYLLRNIVWKVYLKINSDGIEIEIRISFSIHVDLNFRFQIMAPNFKSKISLLDECYQLLNVSINKHKDKHANEKEESSNK